MKTPETDRNTYNRHQDSCPTDVVPALICRRIERERDAARELAKMATETLSETKKKYGLGERNVMKEKDCRIAELESAIRNFRDVSGRHHSQIACERLFALLPENNRAPSTSAQSK